LDKLDPKCFKNEIGFAITNRGQLIPCCRCDTIDTLNDPKFKKLLSVSNIVDYNNIKDILNTQEWQEFYQNLKNHQGPAACYQTCRANKKDCDIQKLEKINPTTNEIIFSNKR